MKLFRHGGLPSTIKSTAHDKAMTASVARPRQTRNVGTGKHLEIGRQQLPSGNGPDSHAPSGRVQRQRPFVSPGFVSRTGLHSAVARQRPLASGPGRQAIAFAGVAANPILVRPRIILRVKILR